MFTLSPRFRITVLPADDPLVALRRPSTLRIDVAGWPGEVFTLWFPEAILARNLGTVAANWEPGNEQRWQWDARAGVLQHAVRRDAYAYEARIAARGDLLDLTLRFTNGTGQTYRDGWVDLCLRTCHARSFNDADLARTFLRFEGQWTPLRQTTPGTAQPSHRLYLMRDEVAYYVESLSDWPDAVPPQRADHPLVAVVSADGARTVGMASQPCIGFVSNLDEDMRCLHSNPLLGDVSLGATVEARAALLFVRGGLEQAVGQADRWLATL